MRRIGTVVALMAGFSGIFLSGCSQGGGGVLTQSAGVVTTAKLMQGKVFGGQQPVTGSTIQLWAVGTGGYGSSATALLTAANVTDGSGNFSITGDYTCPAANTLVYLTATGGNPGLTAGTNNGASVLMSALGQCGNLTPSTFIFVNEVSTVASAYALAQFMNPATGSVGSYGYARRGLVNAFSTVNSLVNTATGNALAQTPGGNGVVPQAEINTLADILSVCVNSSSAASSGCSALFTATTPSGGSAPTNTLLAALSVARHPANNVASLFGQLAPAPPFQPTLGSAPNDWTVALSYATGASAPKSIAVDGAGNVWTANYGTGGTSSSVSRLSPTGIVTGGSPFTQNVNGTFAVGIDVFANVWIANNDNSSAMEFANNGTSIAGPFTNNGLNNPKGVAIDANGNVWFANSSSASVVEFSNGSSQTFTGGGLNNSQGIAIDGKGNAWIANISSVTELNGNGTALSPVSGFTAGGDIVNAQALAIDGSNNVWVPSFSGLVKLDNSGTRVSPSGGYTGGGVGPAGGVAIDGGGNVWVPARAGRLAEFSSAGVAITPSTGYVGGNLNVPTSVATDASGNVWVSNNTSTTVGSLSVSVSEFVGVAVPTVTPMEGALGQGQVGVTPGTPIPLVIHSTALPYYTVNASYSAQLRSSGGNSGTSTWSLASGTLPTGLTLSSAGLISGTPTVAGSSSFTVQVADTANPTNLTTAPLTLTASTSLPVGGNESALHGKYGIRFDGFRNGSAQSTVYGVSFVGGLTFDGAGVVSGEMDFNGPNGSVNTTVSGSYTLGSDNRGTMIFVSALSGATPLEFAFSVGNISAGVAQSMRLIEFDDTVTSSQSVRVGSGEAKLQNSGSFVAGTLNQSFVFGLQGETACTNYNGINASCPVLSNPFGPLSAVGKFTGDGAGNISFGEEDAGGPSVSYNGITLSGSYTNPDSSGRGTLTLTPSGTLYPNAPTHFAYYLVNAGEMFILSTDGHNASAMLSGDALAQSGSFSNSTLTGSYVGYESSASGGDGLTQYPSGSGVALFLVTTQSGSQFTLLQDVKDGGGLKLEQSQSGISFAVDSNGRMTLSGTGGGAPVFYLANGNQIFGTEQPSVSNGGNTGLITLTQQSGSSFSCSTPSGNFLLGTVRPPVLMDVDSGVVTQSSGSVSATIDQSQASGVLTQGGTDTLTCSSDSVTATTGRVAYSDAQGNLYVGYTISPNNTSALINITPGNTTPSVSYIQK